MALLNETAIRDVIAEVLTGAILGVRAIPADNLSADAAEGMDDLALSGRALTLPVFTVAIGYEPLDDPPPQPSNIWIEQINVTITQTSLLFTAALTPAQYRAAKAGSATISSAIRIAFSWPGKLSTSAAGSPTGILSGVLRWTGLSVIRDQAPQQGQAEGGGLYQTRSDYTGFVQTAASTS